MLGWAVRLALAVPGGAHQRRSSSLAAASTFATAVAAVRAAASGMASVWSCASPESTGRAYAMVTLYTTPWTFLFFTLGRAALRRAAQLEGPRLNTTRTPSDVLEVCETAEAEVSADALSGFGEGRPLTRSSRSRS